VQLLHQVEDVERKADGAGLVRDRTRHRLADPPGGVRRKLVSPAVVELLDGPHEPHVPLLDQVEERDAGRRVGPCHRDHEAKVGLDELALGRLVAHVLAPRQVELLGAREEGAVADLADVRVQQIDRRRLALDLLHVHRLGSGSRLKRVRLLGVVDRQWSRAHLWRPSVAGVAHEASSCVSTESAADRHLLSAARRICKLSGVS
jgi:hypothetical protein